MGLRVESGVGFTCLLRVWYFTIGCMCWGLWVLEVCLGFVE